MSSLLIPSTTSRPRSRIRRVFLQINSVLSLQESNWKMDVPFQTTTSRRNLLFTWYFVFVEVCRFSSRHSRVKPSLSMSSHQTPSTTSRPRFRIKRVFLQISSVLSLLESNWRMGVPFPTTTSRRNLLFTWYFVFVEVTKQVYGVA